MYDNYFKNHSYSCLLDKSFPAKDIGVKLSKDMKILEIGVGGGLFANLCHSLGVKDYVGLELDKQMATTLQKKFPKYTILAEDAISFLTNTTSHFDIVYMSHVFEHLSLDDGMLLSKLIYEKLTPDGCRINFMPNAGSILGAYTRYNDITHKIIYTTNSFDQVLQGSGFQKDNIKHSNVFPGSGIFKYLYFLLHPLRYFFLRLIFGYSKYYTIEFRSLIRK